MHEKPMKIKQFLTTRAQTIKKIIAAVFFGVISSIIATQIINFSQETYQIGDYISLGSYEQDDIFDDGKEEIEWIVLDKNNGAYLLISRYVLDAQAYNDDDIPVSWENSTLRAWLNSTFLEEAFSKKEQKKLLSVMNENPDNPEYNTDGGNATQDKVFLLSIQEAAKYLSLENGLGISTKYGVSRGAYALDSFKEVPENDPFIMENAISITTMTYKIEDDESENRTAVLYFVKTRNCLYYLRSPGSEQNMVAVIRNYRLAEGFSDVSSLLEMVGVIVDDENVGIRPVIWYKP